jgi:hypothetical protein
MAWREVREREGRGGRENKTTVLHEEESAFWPGLQLALAPINFAQKSLLVKKGKKKVC